MKLFTYGTLQRGQHNHDFLKGARFIGKGHTEPGVRLIVKGLPYLIEDPEGEGCNGELYEVTNLQLKRIDFLEGHPEWYVREKIDIFTDDGDVHEAWVYMMPVERMGR